MDELVNGLTGVAGVLAAVLVLLVFYIALQTGLENGKKQDPAKK